MLAVVVALAAATAVANPSAHPGRPWPDALRQAAGECQVHAPCFLGLEPPPLALSLSKGELNQGSDSSCFDKLSTSGAQHFVHSGGPPAALTSQGERPRPWPDALRQAQGERPRPWPDGGPTAANGGIRVLGPPPPSNPRRVVSLAPSATDIVVALGLGDRLVGVTRFDHAPEVKDLARVGGFLDPSVEAVVALRPDLVLWLADGGALPAVTRIAALGIPVMAIPIVSVADVLASCRAVGRALNDSGAGERLASGLEDALARVRRRAAPFPVRRVLLVVGREPLVVAGPGSYPDELLQAVGGRNVVGGSVAWPVYPLERAAALDPEVVVDAAVNEHGATPNRSLSAIPTVRRGGLRTLESDDALRPGPRLARALEQLFEAVHPEAAR
jgi:iron complex transport system substrate-binding protein